MYRVELWHGRGASAVQRGAVGPYADRAAALADAAALAAPGLSVRVVRTRAQAPKAARKAARKAAPKAARKSSAARRNVGPLVAAAARALGPLAVELAASMARSTADRFAAADTAGRVAMLRGALDLPAFRLSPLRVPLRLILRDDARAAQLAQKLADALETGAFDKALQSATVAAEQRLR